MHYVQCFAFYVFNKNVYLAKDDSLCFHKWQSSVRETVIKVLFVSSKQRVIFILLLISSVSQSPVVKESFPLYYICH